MPTRPQTANDIGIVLAANTGIIRDHGKRLKVPRLVSRVVTELIPDFLNAPIFDPKNRERVPRIFSHRIRRIFVALLPHHYDKRTVGEFQNRRMLPLWLDVLMLMVGEAVNELLQALPVSGHCGIVLDEG